MGYRTHNEPVTAGERAFLLASTMLAVEEGYVPVKVKHFAKQTPKKE